MIIHDSGEAARVRSRVQLFEAIRRDHRREELSIRELAPRYRVHRRTVRAALDNPVPPPRKTPERPAPKLEPIEPLIGFFSQGRLLAPPPQIA